jgi:hypothetical protein
MSCTRGCCATPAEHYRSVATRVGDTRAKRKVSVERTDTVEATTTEHWRDRQDVNVRLLDPIVTHMQRGPDGG